MNNYTENIVKMNIDTKYDNNILLVKSNSSNSSNNSIKKQNIKSLVFNDICSIFNCSSSKQQ
jgi:hypothetical protein